MQGSSRIWCAAALIAALAFSLRTAAAFDASAPAKPGLAYDEIVRVIPPGATPPPLGSFEDDAAAIAALPPLVVPKASELRLGTIKALASIPSYAGLLLSRAAEYAELARWKADLQKQNDDYASGTAARRRTGVLVKFAYLGSWNRVDVTPSFATIAKPEQGLLITLDGDKKTYHTVHTAAGVETYTVQSGRATVIAPSVAAPAVVEALTPVRSGGYTLRGYRTSGSIVVPQSTFLCVAGEHRVVETEYLADVADPQYDASTDSTNAKPLIGSCALGSPTSHQVPGRLVLYRAITVDPGTATEFSAMLERGNIRALDERDAPLFAPPAQFAEVE